MPRSGRLAFAHLAVLLLATTVVGCNSGAGRYAGALPGVEIAQLQRFYVQHREGDPRDIHLDLQREMQAAGLRADAGKGEPTGDYDAVVTYVDRYQWDMTMYCIMLTVYVRDVRTGNVVATGWSYRPSIVRKTPAGHAKLIIRELFGGGES